MRICRIAVEQQLRTEAEHEVAETWKKVNSYRRQLKEAEMEADSMASRKDHTAELKEKCLDLEDRSPICCLPCLGLHLLMHNASGVTFAIAKFCIKLQSDKLGSDSFCQRVLLEIASLLMLLCTAAVFSSFLPCLFFSRLGLVL